MVRNVWKFGLGRRARDDEAPAATAATAPLPPAPAPDSAGDMTLDQMDPRYRRFAEDYLRTYGFEPSRFFRPVPRADTMFFSALLPNYEGDASIALYKLTEATLRLYDAVRQIVDGPLGGFGKVTSVLDFASGYGRLTRLLEQKLKPEQIYVSDILEDAMAWQARTFGVNALQSTAEPEAFTHDGRHDLVFVGSLFSHLPDELFRAWLKRLYQLIRPGGVLAFSVHDVGFLPPGEQAADQGLSYYRVSECALDADIYGMAYVTADYVAAAIAELNPQDPPAWKRFPKAAYENQDLFVVAGPEADLRDLVVASTPMGGLESVSHLPNGQVELAGWAIERTPGERIAQVVAQQGGMRLTGVEPQAERPDVLAAFPNAANTPVAWRLRLWPHELSDGFVRIELQSTSGLSGYCYTEAPRGLAYTYSGWSRRALAKG